MADPDDRFWSLLTLWALGWGGGSQFFFPPPDSVYAVVLLALCCLAWRLQAWAARAAAAGDLQAAPTALLPVYLPFLASLALLLVLLLGASLGVLACQLGGDAAPGVRWVHIPLNAARVWLLETAAHAPTALFLQPMVTPRASAHAFGLAGALALAPAALTLGLSCAFWDVDGAEPYTGALADLGGSLPRLVVGALQAGVALAYGALLLASAGLLRLDLGLRAAGAPPPPPPRPTLRPYAWCLLLTRALVAAGLFVSAWQPDEGAPFSVPAYDTALYLLVGLAQPLCLLASLDAETAFWRGDLREAPASGGRLKPATSSYAAVRTLRAWGGLLGYLFTGKSYGSYGGGLRTLSPPPVAAARGAGGAGGAGAMALPVRRASLSRRRSATSSSRGVGAAAAYWAFSPASARASASAARSSSSSASSSSSSSSEEGSGGVGGGGAGLRQPLLAAQRSASAAAQQQQQQQQQHPPGAPAPAASAPSPAARRSGSAGAGYGTLSAPPPPQPQQQQQQQPLARQPSTSALLRGLRSWMEDTMGLSLNFSRDAALLPMLMDLMEEAYQAGMLLDFSFLRARQQVVHKSGEVVVFQGTCVDTRAASARGQQAPLLAVGIKVFSPAVSGLDSASLTKIAIEVRANLALCCPGSAVALAARARVARRLLGVGGRRGGGSSSSSSSSSGGSAPAAPPPLWRRKLLVPFVGLCNCPPDVSLVTEWCPLGDLRSYLDREVRAHHNALQSGSVVEHPLATRHVLPQQPGGADEGADEGLQQPAPAPAPAPELQAELQAELARLVATQQCTLSVVALGRGESASAAARSASRLVGITQAEEARFPWGCVEAWEVGDVLGWEGCWQWLTGALFAADGSEGGSSASSSSSSSSASSGTSDSGSGAPSPLALAPPQLLRLTPKALQRLSLALDCASALALLHACQPAPYAHRDIKPHNFFLAQCRGLGLPVGAPAPSPAPVPAPAPAQPARGTGEDPLDALITVQAMLGDFGEALPCPARVGASRGGGAFAFRVEKGTVAYMAPEVSTPYWVAGLAAGGYLGGGEGQQPEGRQQEGGAEAEAGSEEEEEEEEGEAAGDEEEDGEEGASDDGHGEDGSGAGASPDGRPEPGTAYTHTSDVYSLGFVLWEALTGYASYQGFESDKTLRRLARQHLRPPMPPACPAALAYALKCAWHPDPAARPSATALARVLKRLLDAAVQRERGLVGVA